MGYIRLFIFSPAWHPVTTRQNITPVCQPIADESATAVVDTAVSSFLHSPAPFPYSLFLLLELSGEFRLFFPLVLSLYFSPVPPPYSHRYLLLILILHIAVVGLVKIVFRLSRPSSISVAVHANNFFPSGPASRDFLVATAIQLSLSEIGSSFVCAGAPGERVLPRVWAWAWAISIAATRILLGRHYL